MTRLPTQRPTQLSASPPELGTLLGHPGVPETDSKQVSYQAKTGLDKPLPIQGSCGLCWVCVC